MQLCFWGKGEWLQSDCKCSWWATVFWLHSSLIGSKVGLHMVRLNVPTHAALTLPIPYTFYNLLILNYMIWSPSGLFLFGYTAIKGRTLMLLHCVCIKLIHHCICVEIYELRSSWLSRNSFVEFCTVKKLIMVNCGQVNFSANTFVDFIFADTSTLVILLLIM